eukprot:10413073-Ditylum_brightwellii.AAC.1
MMIAKDFSREAIQLVNTTRPLIEFDIKEGVTDKKLGESRAYKLCTQPKEEKFLIYLLTIEVKQVPKGQNMINVDASYTLVQDLLRGDTLTAFNNKRAAFE